VCVHAVSVNSPFGNNVVIDCGMMLNVAFASTLCVRIEAKLFADDFVCILII
jgi:hypothetical protein